MIKNWSDLWIIFFYATIVGAVLTLVPIVWAFLKKVKLDKTPQWFGDADTFEEQKQRLVDHEIRMEGSLIYWKNKAVAHHRLHIARVIWSLVIAVTLPVLVQFFDKTNPWSVAFLTTLTVISGFVIALAHALKSEEMFRGFRQCESDYYDLARALLNSPAEKAEERKKQVDQFIETIERIRKAGRKVETGSPPSGLNNS